MAADASPATFDPVALRRRAESGDPRAQLELGTRLHFGDGLAPDPAEAFLWLRQAAEAGLPEAQSKVGFYLFDGLSVDRDEKAAVGWFRKGARGGYAKAAANLGVAYEQGRGVRRDLQRARFWYLRAAGMGNSEGHRATYRLLFDRDAPRALEHLRQAARAGDNITAMVDLGRVALAGKGAGTDATEAERLLSAAPLDDREDALDVLFALRRLGAPRPPRPPHLAAVDGEVVRLRSSWPESYAERELEPETSDALLRAAEAGDPVACRQLGLAVSAPTRRPRDWKRALDLFLQAARKGDAEGAFHAALILEHGELGPPDHPGAVELFRQAAGLGHALAARWLAVIHRQGRPGVAADGELEQSWWRRAADLGSPDALAALGLDLLEGRGVPADEEEGLRLVRLAAEKGFPAACGDLGWRLARDAFWRRASDPDEALRFLRLGGVQGDPTSHFFAGLVLREWGASEDVPEMAYWFDAAADRDPRAAFELGKLFRDGRGVPRSLETAVAFFARARDAMPNAEFHVGRALLLGSGAPKAVSVAIRALRRAAEKHDADAASALGVLYDEGHGVPRDAELSRQWFETAADLGHPEAPFVLGRLHFDGRGVEPDPGLAVEWLQVAADGKHAGAEHLLALMCLRGEGTVVDVPRARKHFLGAVLGRQIPSLFTTLEDEASRYRRAATRRRDLTAEIESMATDGEAGDAQAALEAGLIFWNYDAGVAEDVPRAVRLLVVAAEKGNTLAQACLAAALAAIGDEGGSREWLEAAAEAGLPGARRELARQILEDRTPEQRGDATTRARTEARARELLGPAADSGDPVACRLLADLLEGTDDRDDRVAARIAALRAFVEEYASGGSDQEAP